MTHTITIIGTQLQVEMRPCRLCPGNGMVLADKKKWAEHQDRHMTGDVLTCVKCGHTLLRKYFPTWTGPTPICRHCAPKRGLHHTGRHKKTSKDYYRLNNPVIVNSGHGRPPKQQMPVLGGGKVGRGASTRRKGADAQG